MFVPFILLQLFYVHAHSIVQPWHTFTSTLPNSQVSIGFGWDCQTQTLTISGSPSTSVACADTWWANAVSSTSSTSLSETFTPATSTCSSSPGITWVYGSAISRNATIPFGSSSRSRMRTVTVVSPHTVTETLSPVATAKSSAETLPEITLTESTDGSSKVVIGPGVMATLTTWTLPAETITETHTHSATFMTTVTTSLLCTCDERDTSKKTTRV